MKHNVVGDVFGDGNHYSNLSRALQMLWSVNQKNPYISIDMQCCWWCFQCNGRGGSFGGMIRLRLQSGVLEKTKVLMASIFLVEQKIS